jgi:DNA-binding NtrC family response regulator
LPKGAVYSNIAIVDDEQDLVELYSVVLKSVGLTPVGYTCPMKAFEDIESKPMSYNMLITDVKMPKMNGYQLVKKVSELNDTIRIIMMSAYDNLQSEAEYNANYEVLRKPISNQKLINVVKDKISN